MHVQRKQCAKPCLRRGVLLAALDGMTIEVRAATEIAASPSTVWSVLTDFARFSSWNPFIRRASGSAEPGKQVHVHVRPSLGIPLAFHATVLDSEVGRELHWDGHVLAPWLARGEHWFTIEPIDEHRVRFEQRERFSGVLPRLAARLLRREAKRGFEAMNAALAARAHDQEARS